ncbi:MAG: flagellar biosynthesis protein FlhF [Succinivibrionaceae bacterium]|nr:flagellar biosynthesis protein FlhF [Succinivibrionaceae bacterium]
MKIRRFFASDMRTALTQVKDELGPDAVIMSNKKVTGGVEIVAAYDGDEDNRQFSKTPDYDDENVTISSRGMAAANKKSGQHQASAASSKASKARAEKNNAQLADTLSELLARQKNVQKSAAGKQGFAGLQGGDQGGPKTLAEQEAMNHGGKYSAASGAGNNAAVKNVAASNDPALNELQREVASIRKLLQSQLAGLMNEDRERNEPIRAMITKLLMRGGFAEDFAMNLTNSLPASQTLRQSWRDLETTLVHNMIIGNDEILRHGGAVTLVGPTGVGKTTTIAKLAAHFSMKYGSDQVALVTTDNYRIGAYEQLQTYGRIMGCVVKSLSNMSDMQNVLYQLRNKRLVLIDTAGMGQRDQRLAVQLDELINSCNVHIHNYLVLPATGQRKVLQDAYEQFSRIELSGAVLTKLDESLCIGDALSVCMQNQLPISYVTNGQRVPEDLSVANAQQLVHMFLSEMEDDTPQF